MTQSTLPETDVARVRHYCEQRVSEHARHQVRVEADVEPRHITIVERRAPWRAEDAGEEWTRLPVARLHYTKSSKLWTLYCRDRNLKFHLYDPAPPAESIATLLSEIDKDPTGIFWG